MQKKSFLVLTQPSPTLKTSIFCLIDSSCLSMDWRSILIFMHLQKFDIMRKSSICSLMLEHDIARPFQCNIILCYTYDLMYSINHVACNVNNYFELTCIKLPWDNVKIRNVNSDQYPVGTRESNTGLYKITNDNESE